jgi:acyl carrier protein
VDTVDVERMSKLQEIVAGILELETHELTPESLFMEDHEADSLRVIEILAALEKNFGVAIDQAEIGRMVNLEGVYQVLTESAEAQS